MYFLEGSIDEIFTLAVKKLLADGKPIIKNNKKINEIYPTVFKIISPDEGILSIKNRSYNPAFMVAETFWNLLGKDSFWLTSYNRIYEQYFDSNRRLRAGYGKRIFSYGTGYLNQIDRVANILKENPNSQHGTITIFNPEHDLNSSNFVPCISFIKFKIRNNKLHMSTTMRAQDIWIGFPYDIHLLLSIFDFMAELLNIEKGTYYHYCDVLRLYEANFEAAKSLSFQKYSLNNKINVKSFLRFKNRELLNDYCETPTKSKLLSLLSMTEDVYLKDCLYCLLAYRKYVSQEKEVANDLMKNVANVWREIFEDWKGYYYEKK